MLESYSDLDPQRWLHIPAIEWTAWPSFITQPTVPILFIFFAWYWVLLGVFLIGIPWCAVRYIFISPRLAQFAVFFEYLKWPAALRISGLPVIQREYVQEVVTLLWPFVVGLIGIPGKMGVIELALAKKVGYAGADATS
jgi:hypothetical protein